jgi:hypothetical protein
MVASTDTIVLAIWVGGIRIKGMLSVISTSIRADVDSEGSITIVT